MSKVNFLNCSNNELHFEIVVNNGRTFYFRFYTDAYYDIDNISPIGCYSFNYPKSVIVQAKRVFDRFLNWLLILDVFKASITGSNLKSVYIEDRIFKHWRYKMYNLEIGCELHSFTNYYLFNI